MLSSMMATDRSCIAISSRGDSERRTQWTYRLCSESYPSRSSAGWSQCPAIDILSYAYARLVGDDLFFLDHLDSVCRDLVDRCG